MEKEVYLKRHIDKWLAEWRKNPNRKPALIRGIRQSGKTKSIQRFINDKNNYSVAIYLNFWDTPELIRAFEGDLKIDKILQELSVMMELPPLKEGNTIFFFDEIQECPRALLSLKTNERDDRFDFIASGSYLGIKGYAVGDSTPKPVGSTEEFDMRTMDFEEFLWAKGISENSINMLSAALKDRKPLSTSAHESFTKLFREYLCVGGFPESVAHYVLTKNVRAALNITRRIIGDLQDDFGRRHGKDLAPAFNAAEVTRIREAFSLIPFFLGKENKRYVLSKMKSTGAKNAGKDALEYLKEAGVITKVHNLSVPSTPLSIQMIDNQYKVFPTDIGILVGVLEDGVIESIWAGDLGFGKGMLYEALIAEALHKRGGKLFYFAKESGLKLDFVINRGGASTILEVKAVNGNAKSAKTVLAHPEHYGKTELVVIKDSNVNNANGVLTIPHYLAFLLLDWSDRLSY